MNGMYHWNGLAKGRLADMVVLDPYASLVFVRGIEDIDRVYVGGDLAVLHGKVSGQDVDAVRHEAESRVR